MLIFAFNYVLLNVVSASRFFYVPSFSFSFSFSFFLQGESSAEFLRLFIFWFWQGVLLIRAVQLRQSTTGYRHFVSACYLALIMFLVVYFRTRFRTRFCTLSRDCVIKIETLFSCGTVSISTSTETHYIAACLSSNYHQDSSWRLLIYCHAWRKAILNSISFIIKITY